MAFDRPSVLAGGVGMSCYGQPDTNPQNQQTEAGRTGQHIKNAQNVPPYSTAAGERERKERK